MEKLPISHCVIGTLYIIPVVPPGVARAKVTSGEIHWHYYNL